MIHSPPCLSASSSLHVSTVNHLVPDPPTAYLPSEVEAKHYPYGFPSKPRLVARSNPDVWVKPRGMEAYLKLKELISLEAHPLSAVLQDALAPSLDAYLKFRSRFLTPFSNLIGVVGEASSPFVLVGIKLKTLIGQAGLDAALGCRSILVENGFDDVHVIILESVFS